MVDEPLVPTICPYCGVGCGLYIRKGESPKIEYMPDHPVNEGALCPKGNAALEILNHPDRLRHPLKKTEDGWIRISWDEALDLVAEKLKETLREDGPDALGFLGSAKCTNEENYLFQKMARLLGTNNVDSCARLCHSPTIAALIRAFGTGGMTNPIPDLANSDCIFVIGSNLAENHPIVARWVLRAKDRGATVIVADPRLTPTAWLADQFLRIRPGTDVALLNGMMHVIVEEGLADEGFIRRRTTGFEDLASSLEEYTPEKVSKITGVPAGSIVRAARTYARSQSSAIAYSMGITQHTVGTDNVSACANLALICGQIGRVGVGVYPLRGQNNVQGACDMGVLAEFYPGYGRVDDSKVVRSMEERWGRKSLPTAPGLTATEMMTAAADGNIKAMYIMGEDPVSSDPNSSEVRASLEMLDFLVLQDVFMTETAEFADLVLPAAVWAEKEGTFTSTERRVQWTGRVFDPPGEAKPDLWIVQEIANRMGLKFDYAGSEDVLAEISEVVSGHGGMTKERLTKSGGLVWPCNHPDHPGSPVLHEEGFQTSDGRARIVPVEHRPPAEETSQDYPLVLTTGRTVLHYNAGTLTRRTRALIERMPLIFAEINPEDAERLGIEEGDWVEVTSARGRAQAKAKLTRRVEPGVVFMPFHFPETNRLTTDAQDPVAKIPELKVASCRVGRV